MPQAAAVPSTASRVTSLAAVIEAYVETSRLLGRLTFPRIRHIGAASTIRLDISAYMPLIRDDC